MKIVVRVPNWLGDAVISLPALRMVRAAYPQARIEILADQAVAPLYAAVLEIDRVAKFDLKTRKGKKNAVGWLREYVPDVGLLFTNSFSSALIFWRAGLAARWGLSGKLRRCLLTNPVRELPPDESRHQVYSYTALVEKLTGIPYERLDFSLDPTAEGEAECEQLWRELGLRGRNFFGIHPGASYGEAKRWPSDQFRRAAVMISRNRSLVPLLLAGPNEKEMSRSALPTGGVDLAGRLSLAGLLAVLRRIRFLLCNDSGPMHLAAAVGTPVVALFASTSPNATGPLGAGHQVIAATVSCRPCFSRTCNRGYKCQQVITPEQLEIALKEQKQGTEMFGEVLLRLGYVEEEMLYYPILAEQLGLDFVNLKQIEIHSEAVAKISAQYAYYYKVMPIEYKEDVLTIALTDPQDIHVLDGIHLVTKCQVKTVLASEKDIFEAIRKYYGVGAETIEQIMGTTEVFQMEGGGVEELDEEGAEASISKFVNQILLEAYKDRATDIHIEPYEKELAVRYRIDGTLYDAKVPSNIRYFMDTISSRIKIMANLSIAEKRLPQDGRFKVRMKDVDLDLRISFLPTPFGESIVIRILNATKLYTLEEIGLSASDVKQLDGLIRKPHGIIFLTGPTGSGKTTTLYSCLSRINQIDRKIITIEDPIEYQIRGITQTQINPLIGFNFKEGLRSILRHDPDIIMVGEVRDLETAEIAIQVALTGHLVFSTLHTNDAASGVTRLLDMGLDAYLISSSVQCFIAQRLVRLLCPECKVPISVTVEMAEEFGVKLEDMAGATIYKEIGCEKCNHTGFHGRQGIYEFLVISEEIRDMIMARVTANQIKQKAMAKGMRSLRQDGWDIVKKGLTTPSEVVRVTQEEG